MTALPGSHFQAQLPCCACLLRVPIISQSCVLVPLCFEMLLGVDQVGASIGIACWSFGSITATRCTGLCSSHACLQQGLLLKSAKPVAPLGTHDSGSWCAHANLRIPEAIHAHPSPPD
eukprot:3734183-Amphidinium_carterae.2